MNKEESLYPYIIGAYGNKTCGKVYIQKLEQENKQLKEEIKGLKNLYENMALEFNKSEERIDKAIEYCNSYSCWTGEDGDMYETDFCIDDLLEILKGDSNESN